MSGTVIGNYYVEECIGRGGMGVVYRGHHTKLPREVAIKSISARGGRDLRRLRDRFEREAFIQSQLDHPGIVKVYDYIVSEQTYYIVMEYIEGQSLARLLSRQGGPLSIERALDLFEQILGAVAHAHKFIYRDVDGATRHGIIHRDLKPANILVTADDRIKITDFGTVKLVGTDTDSFGTAYGSPPYVSPEQALGDPVNQPSDIYSLGIILYEMLTGAPPFGGHGQKLSRTAILRAHVEERPRPPSELNPSVPPEIEAVIMRALEKKPERRFQTVTALWRALRAARGLDATDITESPPVAATPRGHVGTAEIIHLTTEHLPDESYVTQPIRATTCERCGSEVGPDQRHCRTCGHDLNASPATAKLTRGETVGWRYGRPRTLLIAAVFALVLLSAALFYFRPWDRLTTAPETAASSSSPPATTAAPPSSSPAAAEGARDARPALVEISRLRVEVDSTFSGYNTKPLTDGVTDIERIAGMDYNRGNWASAETPEPHWIVISFDQLRTVAAVYVYWGFDRRRYMPSRRVELQIPEGRDGWRTISVIEPADDYDRTAFEFAPVATARLRILQLAQQGPRNRPFIMWVREVKVFAVAAAQPAPPPS